jgi:ABC-type multidrug transport system fused ATPase/permease subunit
MRDLATLIPFLRPYRAQMLLVLVSILATTGAGLLGPWLISSLVGLLNDGAPPAELLRTLGGVAALLLFAYATRSVGQFFTMHLAHVVAWNACHDIRLALYRQLQRFSPAFYTQRQSGEIVSRVIKDTDNIEPLVADVVYDFVVSALLAVGIIIIFFTLDPGLMLWALLPLPFAVAGVWWLGRRIMPAFDAEGERTGELSALVQDNVAGMREIQIFGREGHEFQRVGGLSGLLARVQIHARKLDAGLFPVVEGATGLSIVLVVWFGGQRVLAGNLAVEDLVAFVLYLTVLYQPLWSLVSVNEAFQRARTSLGRIGEVLRMPPEVADPANGHDPGRVQGAIRFAGVSFSYQPGVPVLHDIHFEAAPGQTVALVGPTGAGKSTVVGLVARFYDPQAGQVLLDGHDLRTLRLDALRRNISMVLQDVFLFNGSVRENIRFSKPEASDAAIEAAARAADAHAFIASLPQGYDTLVGERGVKLSGGQKQRLSIARAILKDAPILILDEATSAVDSETEQAIQAALARLRQGRTCLVIAHRLSTIRSADQILVLDRGRIVEQGRHDEIVARRGLYQRLYERQYDMSA